MPSSKRRTLPSDAPYRTGRAIFPHPALRFVFHGTLFGGDIAQVLAKWCLRQGMEGESPFESLPGERTSLGATVQPLEECADAEVIEVAQLGRVESDAEVVEVAEKSGTCTLPEPVELHAISCGFDPIGECRDAP